jgi:DNA polymerase III subunit delta'
LLNEVQGQTEGVKILRRVISGQVVAPLLLLGPDGVGRRFSVVEAAKEAFSRNNPSSPHCVQIAKGVHPDLILVNPIDGKDIGVDVVRGVIDRVESFPSITSVRYVIFDGVDRMTEAAANALLKVLEEPCVTTRFFLLATSLAKVLPTIRSRCGLVRYRVLPEKFVVESLSAHTEDSTKALVCARLAEGSVGRAYQYLASGRLMLRNKMLDLLRRGLEGDLTALFSIVGDLEEDDLPQCLHFLSHLLCDLTMLLQAPERMSNLDVESDLRAIKSGLTDGVLTSLVDGLVGLQRLPDSANLLFHVKTYLATSFGA